MRLLSDLKKMKNKKLLLEIISNCLKPLNDCTLKEYRKMPVKKREEAIEKLSSHEVDGKLVSCMSCDYNRI